MYRIGIQILICLTATVNIFYWVKYLYQNMQKKSKNKKLNWFQMEYTMIFGIFKPILIYFFDFETEIQSHFTVYVGKFFVITSINCRNILVLAENDSFNTFLALNTIRVVWMRMPRMDTVLSNIYVANGNSFSASIQLSCYFRNTANTNYHFILCLQNCLAFPFKTAWICCVLVNTQKKR